MTKNRDRFNLYYIHCHNGIKNGIGLQALNYLYVACLGLTEIKEHFSLLYRLAATP